MQLEYWHNSAYFSCSQQHWLDLQSVSNYFALGVIAVDGCSTAWLTGVLIDGFLDAELHTVVLVWLFFQLLFYRVYFSTNLNGWRQIAAVWSIPDSCSPCCMVLRNEQCLLEKQIIPTTSGDTCKSVHINASAVDDAVLCCQLAQQSSRLMAWRSQVWILYGREY